MSAPMLKRWWQPTLVRRVVVALLIAFTIVWIVLMTVQYREARNEENRDVFMRQWSTDLVSVLGQVQDAAELRGLAAVNDRLFNCARERQRVPGRVLLQAWDLKAGRLVYSTPQGEGVALQSQAGASLRQTIGGQAYRVLRSESARWAVVMAVPKMEDGWLLGRLSEDLTKYMVIAFPIVLLPVWLAVRHGLRPLRRLSDRIAHRGVDDLSPVGVDPRYAELKPLVSALDALLSQLRAKIKREHAFVQDAAHELRTPMAVISAQAHVLAKAADAEARLEAEQRMDHAIARASHLVQQLLVLARIDADRPAAPALEDVAQLARQEIAQCAPAAMAREIELSLDAPDALPMRLEAHAFQSVLHNLVDNAVRYGSEGGRVAVELRREAGALVLVVADDGPGIAPAERELVFDRFYRAAGQDAAGSGLGLAIVKQAALRLGGSVTLGAGLDGRGCGFELRVPA